MGSFCEPDLKPFEKKKEGFPTVFKEHNGLYLVSLKNVAISQRADLLQDFLLFMLGGD